MMRASISSSPLGAVYSALWYQLTGIRGIGPIKAVRFMFSPNDNLGGKSPVEAIKCGNADAVRNLIGAMQ